MVVLVWPYAEVINIFRPGGIFFKPGDFHFSKIKSGGLPGLEGLWKKHWDTQLYK